MPRLSLFALDGTTLKVHDTPEHRSHFGAQIYPSGRISSYPQVRGVTLTSVPTHLIRNALFGPYGINEMLYAKQLVVSIPDASLTVFDKGFLSAEILLGLTSAGKNRHFIIPAKANTKWEVIGGTPEDSVVAMRVSPQARKQCPALPEIWQARLVTVMDQSRLEIAKAALNVKCEPNEISFTRAFHLIQYELHWAALLLAHKASYQHSCNDSDNGCSPCSMKNGPVEFSTGPSKPYLIATKFSS